MSLSSVILLVEGARPASSLAPVLEDKGYVVALASNVKEALNQVREAAPALTVVNARPWIGGFISRGSYPPVVLFAKSASIYGKPTADLLWYWFPRMLGVIR